MRVGLRGSTPIEAARGRVVKTYWYAWKGGPRLAAEPGSPEFIATYNGRSRLEAQPPAGVLFPSCGLPTASDDFLSLDPHPPRLRPADQGDRDASSATSRSAPLPTGARAASSWPGATGSRSVPPASRLRLDGARPRTLVGASPRPHRREPLRARRAALSRPRAERSGPTTTRPRSSARAAHLHLALCWPSGRGSGKATSCGSLVRLRRRASGCARARPALASSIPVGAPLKAALDATPSEEPHHPGQQRGEAVDGGRLPLVLAQGLRSGRDHRRHVPRPARLGGDATRARGRDRGRRSRPSPATRSGTCARSSTPTT